MVKEREGKGMLLGGEEKECCWVVKEREGKEMLLGGKEKGRKRNVAGW